jgi:tetratricopeptide (TPR) repeat protein
MPTLELSIASVSSGLQADWSCDGQPLRPAVSLDAAAAAELRKLTHLFLSLFESGGIRFRAPDELHQWGRAIFDRLIAPVWPVVQARLVAGPRQLLLRCTEPDWLNLPWELVELNPDLPLGCDPAWSLLRVPVAADTPVAKPEAGPLRLLFLSAAPTDQPLLDFEKEEDAMLRATARLSKEVIVLPFAETGGIDELAALSNEHRPHVVHLSGHGVVREGTGYFAFEDERGRTDSQPVAEIASRVFLGRGVRCVVLNACQSAQAAAAGLAQKLVEAGVPLVLGWAASVADDRATQFATAFYRILAPGESVPVAVALARQEIWRAGRVREGGEETVDATFALAQLYAVGPAVELVDRAAPPRAYQGPRTEPQLLEDGIKGLREGFIGRRRIQQQLLPALRDGSITFVVLYGMGGMGKSTLATRCANRLKEAGFRVYGVRADRAESPAKAGQALFIKLLDALGRALLMARRDDLYALLTNDKLPLKQRLNLAVEGLRELRIAIVLDNLEEVLDTGGRRIVDLDLAEAYRGLARDLTAGSRVLVTCRYLPAETPTDQPTVLHTDLGEMTEGDFLKFLRRDTVVDDRFRRGELTPELLRKLYRNLGGTPGFLKQLQMLLRTADPNALTDDGAPEDQPQEQARQRYYEWILLPQLYAALSPSAQRLASQLAVSELPLPADALAGLSGAEEAASVRDVELGVAYGLVQAFREPDLPTLYHPPGLLRPWLAAEERVSAEQRQATDKFLAEFWRAGYEKDREAQLRVSVPIELMTCRVHALRCGAKDLFQWATIRLSTSMERASEWRQARALLEEISECDREATAWHQLATIDVYEGSYTAAREKFATALAMRQAIGDRAGEAATWHNLATIDLHEGSYAAAREKFATALAMLQAIGDRAREAGTWHQLASIDLNEGSYAAAREKFAKSLAIKQAIGNRAGEAATFIQLGFVAMQIGRGVAAADLVGLCFIIDQAINHGDAKSDYQSFVGMCEKLGYDQSQMIDRLKSIAASYAQDRGRQLLLAAFPDWEGASPA